MVGKLPKYQKIRDQILQQIEDGVLQAGDRLPVRSELIKQFSVTRTTLDKALNDLIRNGILVSAKRGGTVVANLPQQRKRIAVVSRLSADSMARHNGMPNDVQRMLASMILTAHEKADVVFQDEEFMLGDLEQINAYDNVIWVQPGVKTMAALEPYKSSVYVTNRYPQSLPYASTNHAQAIQAVTEYFIEHFDEDVDLLYIGAHPDNFVAQERVEGFREACQKHRRSYQESLIDYQADDAVDQLMDLNVDLEKTTVIVSSSAIYEPMILDFAKRKGLHRGQNFFYADCDNDSIARGHRPAALTITQDYPKMGEVIMQAAIEGNACNTFIPFTIKGSEQFLLGD